MKICYNCFHTASDSFRFCEKCGAPLDSQNSAVWPEALECGTTLYGRYLIGNVLQQDDSSITYAAQDSRTKGRVAVREYFPRAYSSRSSMRTVSVSEEHRDEYLEGKDFFLQNAEALADETDSDQPPCVQSFFNQNDTAYLVIDYGSPDHLKEFLEGKGFQASSAGSAHNSASKPSPAAPASASAAEKSTLHDDGKKVPSHRGDGILRSEEDHDLADAAPAPAASDFSLPADTGPRGPLPEELSGSSGGYYPGTLPGESINVPHRTPFSGPALKPENARPQEPSPNALWHDVPGSLPGSTPGTAGHGPGRNMGANQDRGPGSGPGSRSGSGPDTITGTAGHGPGKNMGANQDRGPGSGPDTVPGPGPSTGMGTGTGTGKGRKNNMLPIAFIIGILALCLITIMLLIPRIARDSRDLRYYIYSIQRQIRRRREFFERRNSKPDDNSDGNGTGNDNIFDGNGSENHGVKKDSPVKDLFEDLLKDNSSTDEESAKGISSGNFYNKGYYTLLGDECFFSDSRGLYRSSYGNIGDPEKVISEPAVYINQYGGKIYYLSDMDFKIRCLDPESTAAYDIYDYEGEQRYKPESVCINGDWCYFSCKNSLYRFSMEEVSSQSPLHPQDVETVLEDFNADNHIFPSLCFVDGSLIYIGREGIVSVDSDGSRKMLSSRKGRLFSSGSDLFFKYGLNEIYRLGPDGASTQIINTKSGSFITTASGLGDWIYYSLETEDKIELWRLSADGDQNEYMADLGSKGDTVISLCALKAPDGGNADNGSAYVYVYLLSRTDAGLTPVHEAFSME